MNKFLKIIEQEEEEEIETHKTIQRKKGGRPKKSESEKKSEKIFLNITKEQKEKLQKKAKNCGINVNAYLMEALTSLKIF